jgi:hypothetical protein
MAGALSLSLLAALLAVPSVVLAGLPNWEIVAVEELPSAVEPGENAGYAVTIRNRGPSNISQLYFHASEAPHPVYSEPSQGVCSNPNGTLFCSLGSLGGGQEATIIAAFPTPDDGSTEFSVEFFFNTTGLGSGGGDNSHGDELPATGLTNLDPDDNFAGGFSTIAGDTESNTAISASNLVSTSLSAPVGQKNLILTVADETALSDNPACTGCVYPAFTAELHLGDGSDDFGLMKVVIDYQKSLWKTANFSKLSVVHIHDDLSSHEIPFSRSCSGSTECAMFSSLSGGHGRVTLWLAQNGFVKYH